VVSMRLRSDRMPPKNMMRCSRKKTTGSMLGAAALGVLIVHPVAPTRQVARNVTLNAAYVAHPERFVRKTPTPPAIPPAAWINKPVTTREEEADVNREVLR
jgi:hypothetical protein